MNRVPPHRADRPVRAGIPEHGRVPRYYAVKAELFDLVENLGEGTVLPSERELAERFSVSRVTLRQAVSELVLEGKLIRRQGSGTFVAPPKLVQPLSLVSYTEGMRRQGVEPNRTVITVEELGADEGLARDLTLEPGDPIVHLERVLLADDERIGLESTYLSLGRFPDLLEKLDPSRLALRLPHRTARRPFRRGRGTRRDGARHAPRGVADRHEPGAAHAVAAPRLLRRRRPPDRTRPLALPG